MKKKNIIILVVSIVVVILIIMIALFVGIPMYLKAQAKSAIVNITADESVVTTLEKQEKDTFNNQFLSYQTEGDSTTSYTQVLMLFSFVASSNEEQDRKVDVNGTTITKDNVDQLKTCVSKDYKYKIKCVYDDEGYVKTIELKYTQE